MSAQQHVLIIDDDEMWRMLARLALERAGFRCFEAGTVPRGVEVLQAESINTVVTDLRMPGVSGYELCRVVRQEPRWKHIPIVVMTSSNDEAEHQAAVDAGADLTLRKDSEFKQVVVAVRFARHAV